MSNLTLGTHRLGTRMEALRFLGRDRDAKFIADFDEVFGADGVRIIKTPSQAPRANSICERIVGTLRGEVLDRMLILNERHLSAGCRNRGHAANTYLAGVRSIRRQPVLDGLINQYHWAA